MRNLLLRMRGIKSFEELRTYNEIIFPTFKQAAIEQGLLDSDSEWQQTMAEASSFMMPVQLRNLFTTILSQCNPSNPCILWDSFKDQMSADLLHDYRQRNQLPEYTLDQMIYNETLLKIEQLLTMQGLSLEFYEDMPQVIRSTQFNICTLIATEKNYNIDQLQAELSLKVPLLNSDQKIAFKTIIDAFEKPESNSKRVYFVDGPGGTGKTFLYTQVLNYIRSKNKIALAVASSGIAALLLPGGRTAHSRLKIPIKLNSSSTLNLPLQSEHAKLIQMAEIILWDEAPMTHRHAYEALDRSLRDIMKAVDPELENKIFGGKIICFGGDFRQILPVVKKGNKSDTIAASLNKSYLWPHIKVLRLSINERVKRYGNDIEATNFAKFLLAVGEGRVPTTNENFENDTIRIPDNMLVPNKEKDLIDIVFPNLTT